MKIVLTAHQFFPEYFSGTEVLTHSVACELLARGHEVTVFTGYPAQKLLPDAQRFDKYEIDGMHVHRFHHGFTPMGGQSVVSEIEYNNHLAASYFKCLLEKLKPDLIHFFHFSRLTTALVDLAVKMAIPAYYTPTDFWSVCPTSQLLLTDGRVCPGPTAHGGNCIKHVATLTRWRHYANIAKYLPDSVIDKFAAVATANHRLNFPFRQEIAALSKRKPFNIDRLNSLQGIISPTKLMTDVLIRNGVNARLITQSSYGINISGFDGITRPYQQDQPITIGYIGTLAPHKGCHILIDAFNQNPPPEARLKVYGNPADFPSYMATLQAAAKDNENIEFCGTFPNTQISDVLSEIDVLVVPSVWYENTPLVVYSALAAKCPVIASNFPGMSEVVLDGWNGLLFKPGDSKALANSLLRLHSEPELLATLSNNCKPPKSIATYVDELIKLYEQRSSAPKHPLTSQQEFSAYLPSNSKSYIAGWLVVGVHAPKRISLIDAGHEIAVTEQFLPRPDVKDGLKKSGRPIKTINVGFMLPIAYNIDKIALTLQIETIDKHIHRIPYSLLKVGQSISLDGNLLVGLDHEEFPQLTRA